MVAANPATPKFFWSRVKRSGKTKCWHWLGHTERTGYGRIRWKRQRWRAHRLAYLLAHPEWDGKGWVCHTCDNRRCCNPAHLWLGTARDNALDMRAKGRAYRADGEGNGHAKLTDQAIADIRTSSLKHTELAAKYGVSASSISMAQTGRRWAHSAIPTAPRYRKW